MARNLVDLADQEKTRAKEEGEVASPLFHRIPVNGEATSGPWTGRLAYGCPAFKEMYSLIEGGTDCLEHVSVLWKGKLAHMFVDENGIQQGLAPNLRATRIYWNNMLKRNKRDELIYHNLKADPRLKALDMQAALSLLNHACIYGTALLWEGEME